MKTNPLLFTLALCGAAAFTSCERKTVVPVESTQPAWEPVAAALKAQIKAMNEEDLAGFMSYLHPDNPSFSSSEASTLKLFKDYELSNVLEKAEPVSLTEGEAKVGFTQLTQKVSGPEFRDNRVTGVHTLRRDRGVWKIFATEVEGIDYLDSAR